MVLPIPVKTIADIQEPECLVLELKGGSEQIKELFSLRDKIRIFLNKLSTQESVTNVEAIAISTEFYLRYAQSFGGKTITENFKLREELFSRPTTSSFKYPVCLQLTLLNKIKNHIQKNIDLLFSALKYKYRDKNVEVNNYLVLVEVFSFVLENEDAIKEFFDKPEETSTSIPNNLIVPQIHQRFCGVCGTEIGSAVIHSSACLKCFKFFENSKISEINSWVCKNQSGYCALIHNFQYKDSILFYQTTAGVTKPYASNCNVLCKKCRFSRCAQIGLKRSSNQEKDIHPPQKQCLVCRSKVHINDLKICSYCQMFLTDSVEESSHDTISCMRSSDCEVHSQKTANFSACTGCWMIKIKKLGILDAYLRQVKVEEIQPDDLEGNNIEGILSLNRVENHLINGDESMTKILEVVETIKEESEEEEKEEEVKCVICGKVTGHKYQEKSCCGSCKKFFLKCAKSRCFKDFCCSGSSQCEVSGKTSCSHCWWSRCVKSGIYKGFQNEGKVNLNGVKRPLTAIISPDLLNKREKFEDQKAHR